MIEYRDTTESITADNLKGFFVDWRSPLTPEKHLELLNKSAYIDIAIDTKTEHVIGFITAITDYVNTAYIPLLEVLPEYQKQGIGATLVQRMLQKLSHYQCIDLMCDDYMQPYYTKFGMTTSTGMIIRNY